ncbi:MAG: glycosyl hydrolase family 43 [Opitutus sp.]
MIGRPESDFWSVGIVPATIGDCVEAGVLTAARDRICWLPEPGPWRYLADPFGVQRNGVMHVFVEAFDYRSKHAVIEHHPIKMGARPAWQGCEIALAQSVHLSYPFIVEEQNEVFMVPESHRAREVVLYRANQFPGKWSRETALLKDIPAAEPSLIRHEGRWWMFFTIVGKDARDQRELHLAFSDSLTGPWTLHRQNPIVEDRGGARPGGTPFVGPGNKVMLPVQDCRDTYGGRLRLLRFSVLEIDHVIVEHLPVSLGGELVSETHQEGFHTLSQCGDSTLIDVKRISRSRRRHMVDWRRRASRCWR